MSTIFGAIGISDNDRVFNATAATARSMPWPANMSRHRMT